MSVSMLFALLALTATVSDTASVRRGDVDQDQLLSARDALAALTFIVGKPLPTGMSPIPGGDANCDNKVTALDALVILSHVIGRDVSQFCVGNVASSTVLGEMGGNVSHPSGASLEIGASTLGPLAVTLEALPIESGEEGPTFRLRIVPTGTNSPSGGAPSTVSGNPTSLVLRLPLGRAASSPEEVQVQAAIDTDGFLYAVTALALPDPTTVAASMMVAGSTEQVRFKAVFPPRDNCASAYRLLDAPEDADPAGVQPLLFVHGWQPMANTPGSPLPLVGCTGWDARFDPTLEGRELLGRLSEHPGIPSTFRYFRYTYPTFNPIDDAAQALADTIKARWGARNNIVVVAHSMGGLVARAAMVRYGAAANVARLITLGTPHRGALPADPSFWKDYFLRTSDPVGTLIGLGELALDTPGFHDLRFGGPFVTSLDATLLAGEEPTDKYSIIEGTIDANYVCRHGWVVCRLYARGNRALTRLGVSSDGLVYNGLSITSGWYGRFPGYDHSDLILGRSPPASSDPLLDNIAQLVQPDPRNGLSSDQFVLIPAGTFLMGGMRYLDEWPHTVRITTPFYLQETEVTQGQWTQVMGSNPSSFTSAYSPQRAGYTKSGKSGEIAVGMGV